MTQLKNNHLNAIIIDDEPGIGRLCSRLLAGEGFQTVVYSDPQEGVDDVANNPYDLLLVDIRMPGMDGFQVIERTRSQQPDIAVVIMTGFGTLETAIRALRQGVDGLILKPFEDSQELISTVLDAFQQRQYKRELARLRAIRPLIGVAETLFSEKDYQVLMDIILNMIREHLKCQHAGIYRKSVASPDQPCEIIAAFGSPPLVDQDEEPWGQEILDTALHSGDAVLVTRKGPDDSGLQPILKDTKMGSVICVPLERGEHKIIFFAGRKKKMDSFDEADVNLFSLLARQAEASLENARLYEELKENLYRIEASQQALIQTEKMATVGRLTTTIAHEVNNPLQAMRNCLHLVGRKELSEEVRDSYLGMANEELNRLMFTVQRMLDFYRPGKLDKEMININSVIEKVLALVKKQMVDHEIQVIQVLAQDLPLISVVSNQLQQVFWNIILNAMEVMPSGGKIYVTTRRSGKIVEALFEDSGGGVSFEDRDRIFEPFFTNKEDGSGLGLSVSQTILAAHGGEIVLKEPQYGTGACFCVNIPVEEI